LFPISLPQVKQRIGMIITLEYDRNVRDGISLVLW
jgi:hypothetical protein